MGLIRMTATTVQYGRFGTVQEGEDYRVDEAEAAERESVGIAVRVKETEDEPEGGFAEGLVDRPTPTAAPVKAIAGGKVDSRPKPLAAIAPAPAKALTATDPALS